MAMRARRPRCDDGAATTEFVIAAPGFLLMIMLIIQAGLYFHAVSVASAAAQEGARAATLEGASVGEGEQEASEFVQALAPDLLTNVGVSGQLTDGGELVRVTVTGDVVEVFRIPGVDIDYSVRETSEGVIERFRPAGEPAPSDSG
jgi:Flp pilus assembly protein TadG